MTRHDLMVLLLAAVFALGSVGPDPQLQRAYDQAWYVSSAIERLSNCVVDGLEEWCWDEAKLNRAFALVTDVIQTLCRTGRVRCLYPGLGY